MAIPISQFILSSPFPPVGVHTFVLYVCVSIFALQMVEPYCFKPKGTFHDKGSAWTHV